jgi:Zinc carboxypeptidase
MKNHRRTILAVLISAFVIGALVGPAGAHFRKANGNRVSKKHARMHRQQATQTTTTQSGGTAAESVDLAPAGLVASQGSLRMHRATVDAATLQELANEGYDVTPTGDTLDGTEVALVLSAGERRALEAKGLEVSAGRQGREHAARQTAAAESIYGWDVYRSYDEPGGIEDQIQEIANRPQNRGFTRLYDIGDTVEGRDIWAVRLTQGARGLPLGRRPAVLYQATTHAREWISTEVGMRLLRWYVAERRAENPEIRALLQTTELWFVPVVNPDGYEYTFTTERLWRKNLRDNNGDGQITGGDGVDLNRNYPEHWNYDTEGSSSQFASETYRGTTPASEPETQADINLIQTMANFKFAVSYHSFGQLLLYTQGWQTLTPSADDPIYVALTGTDDDPAVEDFNPGVGADLYTTNGEFTDWAHGEEDVLAWTPELSEGESPDCPSGGCGFEFPDDEAQIQGEFERNLDFAVNVAKSALDPDDPVSHAGTDTDEMYLDIAEIDPWKTNWPSSDLKVDVSYAGGESQPVEVLAKRAIGAVTLNFRIDGGATQIAPTTEAPSGEVFNGNGSYDAYYRYLRGTIPGPLAEESSVEYWFTGGGESTEHVTFDVAGDGTADVLIVAAEDRTGASSSPGYTSTDPNVPNFVDQYTAAVTAAGRTYEVYDVDARGRQAPDHTGVLNHYDAVVWYTGNDFVTRESGWGPGNVSRLAVDLVLEHRAYLNETGNLMYTGQRAAFIENSGQGQFYDPVANEQCTSSQEVFDRCLLWGDKNDFAQYYLGAFIYNSGAATPGTSYGVTGTDAPYSGMTWNVNGADSANNQNHRASFITTSSILPTSTYPQFTSNARASYAAAGPNPFEPFDGEWYWHSQQADISYKRLMRPFTMPAGGGDMTFRFSYDTEVDWDFVFVEIHNITDGTWRTAPDLNGHTTNDTGESCPAGWFELHPWLEQYQGPRCSGTGTSGAWNAHSGRSAGWEDWAIDLDAFADPGDQIEISISYASDWAVQGLGAFVDFVQLPGEPVESFETGTGGWTVPGPPPGSAANPNDWTRTQSVGFEEGAIVSLTPSSADFTTLFAGFGLEAIQGATGPNSRADVMDKSLDFLGV